MFEITITFIYCTALIFCTKKGHLASEGILLLPITLLITFLVFLNAVANFVRGDMSTATDYGICLVLMLSASFVSWRDIGTSKIREFFQNIYNGWIFRKDNQK